MGFEDEMVHPFYWPTVKIVYAPMTPAQAWRAWLLGEIDAEEFGRVLNAWDEAHR